MRGAPGHLRGRPGRADQPVRRTARGGAARGRRGRRRDPGRRRAAQELDLGTPIDATPEQSGGRCYFAADGISREARANRDLLARVLGREGLVNYPTEWWHYYGDRYWALATGADRRAVRPGQSACGAEPAGARAAGHATDPAAVDLGAVAANIRCSHRVRPAS